MPGPTTESDWEQFTLEWLAELAWPTAHGTDDRPGRGERPDALGRSRTARPAARRAAALQPRGARRLPAAGGRGDPHAAVQRRDHREPPAARAISPAGIAGSPSSTPTDPRSPRRSGWSAPTRTRTTGWPPTRSRSVAATTIAGSTSSCTATECRSASSSSRRGGNLRVGSGDAHAQLQTYLREFPMAFRFAVFDLASDGLHRPATERLSPRCNHYSPWNVDDDGVPTGPGQLGVDGEPVTALEVAVMGLYNQERFLQLLRSFTAFDERRGRPRQADRQAPPVLRGDQGRRPHDRGGGQQRQGGRRLAHPGLRQVDGDGALHRAGDAVRAAEEPHRRGDHRPEGTRRPAVRGVRPEPAAAGGAPADPPQQRAARGTPRPDGRRHLLHHAAEVQPHDRGEGVRHRARAALRATQHHRDRRRGAPQPLRRPRRLRPASQATRSRTPP